MLLLCRGIGRRAMVKSAIVGLSYGAFTWVCITIWFSSQSKHDEDISEMSGNLIYYFWTLSQLVIYMAVWLMPNSGMFTRRPAAIYWGRFLGLMRFGFTLCVIFNGFRIDFSYCMYHFLNGIVFCGFRMWVTYRTFFLDTLWWHGIAVEVPLWWGAKIPINLEDITSLTEGKPLEGVELSGDSALAMSSALDGFGRARGESLTRELDSNKQVNIEEPLPEGEETKGETKKKSRFSIKKAIKRRSQRFSLTGKKTQSKSPVPLLDFSHLEINTNRLLGVGSTARVYEGNWCNKKCAIKVLFTVEIVPEEIKRICLEAALLHSLQNSSNNVTRLFGIAMLPPSICVVLELCNEGSLNDVLYVKNAADYARKSSSVNGPVSNDRKWNMMMERGSLTRNSLDRALVIQSEHKYKLPWEERLDLILGACEGLAAFAKVLPGYSHNDIKSANYLVHDVLNDTDSRRVAASTKKSFVVKLADLEFASVGVTPEHLHRPGCVANWAAPEVLSNKHPVSPASDVFSLSMTLYEVVVREIPFSAGNAAKNYMDGNRPLFPDYNLLNNPADISSTSPPISPPSSILPPPNKSSKLPNPASFRKQAGTGVGAAKNISNPQVEVMSLQEITSRRLIEAIIVRGWSQEPADRPDILTMTEEVREIVKDYKATMEKVDKNRRATFKGNLVKNDVRSSFHVSDKDKHETDHIAIEMGPTKLLGTSDF
jgi:hypothetical protein